MLCHLPKVAGKGYLRSDLDALEQLVDFVVAELLAETGEDVSELTGTNEAVTFLVKHLETTDEFLWCSCGLEAVWAVENVEERLEVNVFGRRVGQVCNLSLSWVLTQSAEQVS